MEYLHLALKLIISLSILNVWLLRAGKSTPWRGANAASLKAEFSAYGLPSWFLPVAGAVKILLSIVLIASVWYPEFENYAAGGIALMMLGAVIMHVKVNDPLKKSFPAALFLVLSLALIIL